MGRLVAQMVKKPCAVRETWVPSLGHEGGMAARSSVLAWRIPWTEGPGGLYGVTKSQARLSY